VAPPAPTQISIAVTGRKTAPALLPGVTVLLIAFATVLLLAPLGCSHTGSASPAESPAAKQKAAEQQARKAALGREEQAREELEQIIPPSKSRYLQVHDRNAYANPFLVVNPETINITIIFPDRNPESFGTGGLLRPAAARKQQMEIRLADLPQALSSLPPDVWPYGRVVAVEESPAPRGERVAIRRNVEATIQMLNDLGVVVDEWTGSDGPAFR
jgi:hypothetical protein